LSVFASYHAKLKYQLTLLATAYGQRKEKALAKETLEQFNAAKVPCPTFKDKYQFPPKTKKKLFPLPLAIPF
jgi:hypothetical protein